MLALAGFFWFVGQIPTEEVTLDSKADGIVVLTGAATRIPDAIELLAAGRGKRLLIAGVHRSTNSKRDRARDAALRAILRLLHRPRQIRAQYLRQRDRDQALGAQTRIQFA